MTVAPDQFRDLLRCFAAGVTLVTTRDGDRVHGLTVSAFASVSAEPPLVAVIINRDHAIHPLLEARDAPFAVNVLAADQAKLSERFAFGPESERFAIGDWTTAATGAPVLSEAVAWLDCRVEDRHPAGTHVIYVGRVEDGAVPRSESPPLVYWNRGYHTVDPVEPR
ncbi:MAG: flavin reductase family protein [Thermoanaerobaculia bacterium]